MSTRRFNPKRGFCNTDRLPKGPDGRALCRECGVEVPPRRKSFCSDKCVTSWKIRSDATFVRVKLFERDRGVCAICGVDCVNQVRDLEALDKSRNLRWSRNCWDERQYRKSLEENDCLMEKLSELHIPAYRYRKRHRYGIWDADHIVPVVEGGGEASSLDAFRTLCCRCHGEETAKLRKRRKVSKVKNK